MAILHLRAGITLRANNGAKLVGRNTDLTRARHRYLRESQKQGVEGAESINIAGSVQNTPQAETGVI